MKRTRTMKKRAAALALLGAVLAAQPARAKDDSVTFFQEEAGSWTVTGSTEVDGDTVDATCLAARRNFGFGVIVVKKEPFAFLQSPGWDFTAAAIQRGDKGRLGAKLDGKLLDHHLAFEFMGPDGIMIHDIPELRGVGNLEIVMPGRWRDVAVPLDGVEAAAGAVERCGGRFMDIVADYRKSRSRGRK